MARAFAESTAFVDGKLGLGLAPGRSLDGLDARPSFFRGFATFPHVLARGLGALAEITATRYFKYTPTSERDPVLSAHGDRLRAECFSACNSVYACLELFGDGLDGGDIGRGTTNVDVGPASRALLTSISRNELLHVDVGDHGLVASTPDGTAVERPVTMPDRWVRAFGNVADMHRAMASAITVDAAGARAFLASVPAASVQGRGGWVSAVRGQLVAKPRSSPGAVQIKGLQRLSAFKRLFPLVTAMSFHTDPDSPGIAVVSVDLPAARLTLGLTDEPWRGFSGEGALLSALAAPTVQQDADLVGAVLAFEPIIDVSRLARDAALPERRVHSALAVLAASGRVGWAVHDASYFHRELPDDPDRVHKDNPRLKAARTLVHSGSVRPGGDGAWIVASKQAEYVVRLGPDVDDPAVGARCTCAWWLSHGGDRGPCKHVLAVVLTIRGEHP